MKLIKLQFVESSSEAAFLNVTIIIKPLFRKSIDITRRARLDRIGKERFFTTRFEWSDTGKTVY